MNLCSTTLNLIRLHNPCQKGWNQLLVSLNKTHADNDQLTFPEILASNGLDDALWAMRTIPETKEMRLLAADIANEVLDVYEKEHCNDDRPRKSIECARNYAYGLTGAEEMIEACENAEDAAKGGSASAYAAAYASQIHPEFVRNTAMAAQSAGADVRTQEGLLLRYF